MIDQLEKTNMGDAESDVPTVGDDLQQRKMSPNGTHRFSNAVKSLMEEDDEDDDEEDQGLLSRNPSLVDYDEDHRDRNPDENERKGPSHLDRNSNVENDDAAVSERPAACVPSAAIPMCHGDLSLIPGCQGQTFAEQIDFMTQCRHPLEIFSAFHEHPHHQEGVEHNLLPGMYSISKNCEYCGAANSDDCTDECQRPKSFFRKKRPPFCPPNNSQWDPATGFEVPRPAQKPIRQPEQEELHDVQGLRRPSFMGLGDLFRKPSVPAEE